jgi:hypothetical protein
MASATKVPHWAESAEVHETRGRCRFKLYGFNEVLRMTPEEWDEECRKNNVDMGPHLDDPGEADDLAIWAMLAAKRGAHGR